MVDNLATDACLSNNFNESDPGSDSEDTAQTIFLLPELTKDGQQKLFQQLEHNLAGQTELCWIWYDDVESYLLDPHGEEILVRFCFTAPETTVKYVN